MRAFGALVAAGLVAGTVSAQPVELPALMRRLAAVEAATAQFVETRTNALLSAPLVLRGRLVYRRPAYLERHVESPYEERIVVAGETVTIDDRKGGRRTMPLAAGPLRALLESTRATLAGDLAALERYFVVTASGTQQAWQLRLVPRDAALAAWVAAVVIEGSDARVARIEVTEPGGDRTSTVVSATR